MNTRRRFLKEIAAALSGVAIAPGLARALGGRSASEFVFARLRYDSGDWDYNPKVCANVLDSVVQ